MAQPPEQLSLFVPDAVAPRAADPSSRPARRAHGAADAPRERRSESSDAHPVAADRQLPLPLRSRRLPIEVIAGGGDGTGHRRGRLVALDGGAAPARPLPTREEITGALLQGLADLVAGRISVAAAAAIREAAEYALRQLDAAEHDPHARPRFVRAARALQELLPGR